MRSINTQNAVVENVKVPTLVHILTVALSSILSRRNSEVASVSASSVGASENFCEGIAVAATVRTAAAAAWVIVGGFFSTATDGILFSLSYNNSESVFALFHPLNSARR